MGGDRNRLGALRSLFPARNSAILGLSAKSPSQQKSHYQFPRRNFDDIDSGSQANPKSEKASQPAGSEPDRSTPAEKTQESTHPVDQPKEQSPPTDPEKDSLISDRVSPRPTKNLRFPPDHSATPIGQSSADVVSDRKRNVDDVAKPAKTGAYVVPAKSPPLTPNSEKHNYPNPRDRSGESIAGFHSGGF